MSTAIYDGKLASLWAAMMACVSLQIRPKLCGVCALDVEHGSLLTVVGFAAGGIG